MRTSGTHQFIDDIRTNNLSWLASLQIASLRDPALACALYKIDPATANYIASCSHTDLRHIADFPYAISRFDITPQTLDKLLACDSSMLPLIDLANNNHSNIQV